jgi:hypothetical protein
LLAELDTSGNEQSPIVTADGLAIYFARYDITTLADVFVATRDDPQATFSTAVPVASINTAQFESYRTGGYDLYIAERTP